jgi:hypothetical protein
VEAKSPFGVCIHLFYIAFQIFYTVYQAGTSMAKLLIRSQTKGSDYKKAKKKLNVDAKTMDAFNNTPSFQSADSIHK